MYMILRTFILLRLS